MSRNRPRPVLKIRYRVPNKKFGARLEFSNSNGKNGRKSKGRILSIKKIPREQILRVHEFLPFDTENLLREFRETERLKGGHAHA